MAARKRGKGGRFKAGAKKKRRKTASRAMVLVGGKAPIAQLHNLDKRVSRLELKTSTTARERLHRMRSKAEARRIEQDLASRYS